MRQRRAARLPSLLLGLLATTSALAAPGYDVAILGGRVMDPETGLDAVRNVGIRDGNIVSITARNIRGATTIDAAGLVVAAGFIDAHFHWPRPMGYKIGLRDGMTSALDLEFGTLGERVEQWYAKRAGKVQVNYGTSASHELARSKALDGIIAEDAPVAGNSRAGGTRWAMAVPDREEASAILHSLQAGLDAGAVGIGSTLGYMPGVTAAELYRVQALGASYGRQLSAHLRHTPGTATQEINGAQEVLANAAALKAPASIVHFNNPGWEQTYELIAGMQANGHNVWGEIYPYAAGSTTIGAVFLRPETHVEKLGKRYEDTLFDPQSNSFYTRARYERQAAEAPATIVVVYKSDPAEIPRWLGLPGVTMGSDGMPIPGDWPWITDFAALPNSHPRAAGARSKSLRLAREHKIPLMQVLAMLSYNPARYLGDMGLAAMRTRGRMQVDMVADIVVFDPKTVRDNATYAAGNQPSTGIDWVLINGRVTVADGKVRGDVFAGQPIRFAPTAPAP